MMSFIAISIILAVATAASKNDDLQDNFHQNSISAEQRIVGGEVAEPHQFPYQALLKLTKIEDFDIAYFIWCGGSLITDSVVLTAAHCLEDVVSTTIYLGAHNRSDIDEAERITFGIPKGNIHVHEEFHPELYENDIALIILPEKVNLTDKINTVILPDTAKENLEGCEAVTSGWGKTGNYKPASDVLHFVKRRIFKNSNCRNFYGPIKDSQICVDGYPRKSICSGDSGGPLVIQEDDGRNVLVGITSFGRSDGCEKSIPTVFTRVSSFSPWIRKFINI